MQLGCRLVLFYGITGFLSLGWGLTKPSADLGPLESDYIILGELRDNDKVNSYLDCAFDLDNGEELASVTWYHGEISNPVFVWKPNEDPLAYDFLVGRVNMTRNDGNIEFLERHREYEGVYFCEVATNAGKMVSDPYQILTVDLGSRTYTSSKVILIDKECVEVHSESTPALYPAPEVDYGVWSEEQWILEIPLRPFKYPNGSWQYTLKDREIETDKFPEGSAFRLTVGFMRGEEYIPIMESKQMIEPCSKRGDGNEGGNAAHHTVSLVAIATVFLCFLFVH